MDVAVMSRAFGSSRAMRAASLNGWIGSDGCPITSVGWFSVRRSSVDGRCDATEQQAIEHGERRGRIASHVVYHDVDEEMRARDPPGEPRERVHQALTGSQRQRERYEGSRGGGQCALEHRHLEHERAHAFGGGDRGLERNVRTERRAADHRLHQLEVIEQCDHVVSELRHRIGGHLVRLRGCAVAEQIDGNNAMASRREGPSQFAVHPAIHQEAMDEHDGARAAAVLDVADVTPAIRETRHGCWSSEPPPAMAILKPADSRSCTRPGFRVQTVRGMLDRRCERVLRARAMHNDPA
jgi:hypothetical protein